VKIITNIFLAIVLISTNILFADNIKSIVINGNNRVNEDFIRNIMLTKENTELNQLLLNRDLKVIYETDLFENISSNFDKGI
jgi:outer membrane protein assembly factor BamA